MSIQKFIRDKKEKFQTAITQLKFNFSEKKKSLKIVKKKKNLATFGLKSLAVNFCLCPVNLCAIGM